MKKYEVSIYIYSERADSSSSHVIRSCNANCETMYDALNFVNHFFKFSLNLPSVYKVEIEEV